MLHIYGDLYSMMLKLPNPYETLYWLLVLAVVVYVATTQLPQLPTTVLAIWYFR